jgi:hypothetical protein
MPKVLQEVIVVAKHGDTYIDACLRSLGDRYPVVVMDTSEGGHPSAAYVKAYHEHPAHNYLFIQDSMEAIEDDVIKPFKDKGEVVSWAHFHFNFDNDAQRDYLVAQYEDNPPEYGIFGPVFYASRESLEKLDKQGLFPNTPQDKLQAQGTERGWAWAFHKADIKVESLGYWDKSKMEQGLHPPFRKTWGGRT